MEGRDNRTSLNRSANQCITRISRNKLSLATLRQHFRATPPATVNATISTSLKDLGEKSPFLRVGKGEYILRELKTKPTPTHEVTEADDKEEKQYKIISSFGMFWRRSLIRWTSSPRLLGIQQLGAVPVDFSAQQGIYLLYDSREVVYVGRATDRPMGRRLYEHTSDRLSTRWDRFSWFGLLPVSEKGALAALPAVYQSVQMIPALEAILIEAMEPRQNRQRGEGLSAVEYLQQEDPEIKKQRDKETVLSLLDKT